MKVIQRLYNAVQPKDITERWYVTSQCCHVVRVYKHIYALTKPLVANKHLYTGWNVTTATK